MRRRRTERLHAAMRDTHCPVCGEFIRRNHHCRGRLPEPLSPDQVKANADACRAEIAKALAEPRAEQGGLFDV